MFGNSVFQAHCVTGKHPSLLQKAASSMRTLKVTKKVWEMGLKMKSWQSEKELKTLRIDYGDWDQWGTELYVFSHILTIYESIWAKYILNESWMSQLLSGILYIIIYNDDKNICLKECENSCFLPTFFWIWITQSILYIGYWNFLCLLLLW